MKSTINNFNTLFIVIIYYLIFFYFSGKVYAISLNAHIDVEDCISINNNLLKMSLIQSSIQNICLPTKDSSE